MLKPRLIPVLLVKNGILVKSKQFTFHQSTGDPLGQVERFTAWKADELIYLDISREGTHGHDDTMSVVGSTTSKKKILSKNATQFSDVVHEISSKCTIPLTVGGGIRTLDDISILLKSGADKVSINTKAIRDPDFVKQAAQKFGNQCIVVSVDVKKNPITGKKEVFTNFGKETTEMDPVKWCMKLEKLGAGEILLNSIDRDGAGNGYDINLIKSVTEKVSIPVIALGGVGKFEHLVDGLKKGRATAVAAANIFHFTELSIIHAKKYMKSVGIDVRL
jgi:cyclase